jgi:hypothetical protein
MRLARRCATCSIRCFCQSMPFSVTCHAERADLPSPVDQWIGLRVQGFAPLPTTAQVGGRWNRRAASIVASLHTPPRPLQGRAIRCNGCNDGIVWQRAATTGKAKATASCNDCTGWPDRCKSMQRSNAYVVFVPATWCRMSATTATIPTTKSAACRRRHDPRAVTWRTTA